MGKPGYRSIWRVYIIFLYWLLYTWRLWGQSSAEVVGKTARVIQLWQRGEAHMTVIERQVDACPAVTLTHCRSGSSNLCNKQWGGRVSEVLDAGRPPAVRHPGVLRLAWVRLSSINLCTLYCSFTSVLPLTSSLPHTRRLVPLISFPSLFLPSIFLKFLFFLSLLFRLSFLPSIPSSLLPPSHPNVS